MIQIHYFARYREMLGKASEELVFDEKIASTASLRKHLASRGEPWSAVFDSELKVLVAVNQDMIKADSPLQDGDEVAFFPPVTGG